MTTEEREILEGKYKQLILIIKHLKSGEVFSITAPWCKFHNLEVSSKQAILLGSKFAREYKKGSPESNLCKRNYVGVKNFTSYIKN